MDPIDVPKPKGVRDPQRPAGTLLLAQVRHMHEAEKSLPSKYQTSIFHKAVVSEDDAAHYVQAVTTAIHKAHDDAVKGRALSGAVHTKAIEGAVGQRLSISGKRRSGAEKNRNKVKTRKQAGNVKRKS